MVFIREKKRGKHIYLEEVKSVRVKGKVKQVHVRYVGKKVDGKQILSGSINRAEINKVSVYGPLLILDAVAKEMGLSEILGEYGDYLLSLAYGHCVDPGSVKKLTKWLERTDIHSLLNIPDVTYKKLLEAMDSLEGEKGRFIQSKIFKRLQERLHLKPKGYFYDVTNIYFYGVKCPIAKKKKKPKSLNLPQVEVGLAVTKKEGIPIFYKVFQGNIFDSKTLPDILLLFREHHIKKATIIWDRGVSSELNISDAKKVGFDVICGLALNPNLKKIAKTTLAGEEFNSIKNRVRLKNATFYVKKTPYLHKGIKGILYICFNEKEKQRIKERRYDEIDNAIELIKQKEPFKAGIKKYLKGRGYNHMAIREAEKTDGISTIFSTNNLTEKEVVHSYFEKDRVEKAFRKMKSLLEMGKVRFWLKGKVEAHVGVCYLGYLLLSLVDYKLKNLDVDAINALEIMESMYKIHITDPKTKNTFVKTVVLSEQQKKILKAIEPKLLKCSG